MRMAFHKPDSIAKLAVEAGVKKAGLPIPQAVTLGFMAGAFIALGFLLNIRVSASIPKEWASLGTFLGASVFPLGLILTLIAGGELLTGNMMAVPLARLANRVSSRQLVLNWFWITVSNFVGAVFVAYIFGHVVGLTETGPYLTKTLAIAEAKLDESFVQAFFSGIGCNWLVALAVWLAYGAEDVGGKVIGIWFPTMAFVAIGFQHVVANMFVIPAAIFAGHFSWLDYLRNFVPVFLGNAVGGSLFVASTYWFAYLHKSEKASEESGKTVPISVMRGGEL